MHARILADLGLMPSVCVTCRYNTSKNNQPPPCERDEKEICGFTGVNIHDDDAPMVLTEKVRLIISMWEEVTSISRMDSVNSIRSQGKRKEMITKYLPSLEKIDFYFSLQNWEMMPIEPAEAFHGITLFHREYVGVKSSG